MVRRLPRSWRRAPLGAVAVALSLFASVFVGPASVAGAAALVRPNTLAPDPLPSGLRPLGALAGEHALSLEIVLAPADPGQLSSLLDQLYDPSSPRYHQWLTPAAFATRYAPAPSVRSAVDGWLSRLGLQPERTSAFTIAAHGTTAQISDGLGVSVDRYRGAGGSVVYAAQKTPEVPAALAGRVAAIVGLSDAPLETPLLSLLSTAASGAERPLSAGTPVTACSSASQPATTDNGYTANAVGNHYGIDTLVADGANGTGQKIGVFELGASSASDVSAYESCFDLHNPVSVVPVDGGAGPDADGTVEADIDIEQAATQAPGCVHRLLRGTQHAHRRDRHLAGDRGRGRGRGGVQQLGGLRARGQRRGERGRPVAGAGGGPGPGDLLGFGDDGSEDCFDPPTTATPRSPSTTRRPARG
jgi:hypothetical protein